jgi:hypothetical protein
METALGCLFDFLTRRYPAIEEVGKAEREGEAEKRRQRLELSGEFLEC